VTRRRITGMAAVLLPFTAEGAIDWDALAAHVARTREVGLVPAVNMDTGFGALLAPEDRARVLDVASSTAGGFVAGAYVDDAPGAPFDPDGYRRSMDDVARRGGTPVVFPSWGLHSVPEPDLPRVFEILARDCDRFLAFELGEMFLPQGRIFTLETYEALLGVRACVGAKHSSLRRGPELERIALRDRVRPDFMVLTGNDRAIDMVVHGSDYLLGLATFAPDWFAARDAAWLTGDDVAFAERNDLLQYLGQFAFRDPVPAYRHSAAQFLTLRGWIACDTTHPASPRRPGTDVEILRELRDRAAEVFG
jgi:dihydrodipicolinate synthase/N-acetylneuraminate lyase